MSLSLEGKVIVVTGGTGVLGGSFVNAIAQAGGAVCILGRNEKIAQQRSSEIQAAGGKALALVCDVLNINELEIAKTTILNHFGKINGLVNAAGGNSPAGIIQPEQDIFAFDLNGMQNSMNLNLWGTVAPTKIFGSAILQSGGGSIVNISSVSADRALTKVMGYSMGKAAIDAFTKWFAVELSMRHGDKMRMNAIKPGFFITEQNRNLLLNEDGSPKERAIKILANTPFKKFGNPADLNSALIWLLSDDSAFVTGSIVTIDGGFNAFSGV
ncbi:MAG: putative oxidoreductase UxuB [Bacteroidota bacterium]|jgi:NAD(P)-dependent dehydrogenase (short-subunit alcohol dehydrogenase family)